MYSQPHQQNLFPEQSPDSTSRSFNPTYEIKRQIRLALKNCGKSREDVVSKMNEIAVKENFRKKVSEPTLSSWTKDSDPNRLPTLPWLTIFCQAVKSTAPIDAMVRPLGGMVIGEEDVYYLEWAKAKLLKRRVDRRAKLADQVLEDFLSGR